MFWGLPEFHNIKLKYYPIEGKDLEEEEAQDKIKIEKVTTMKMRTVITIFSKNVNKKVTFFIFEKRFHNNLPSISVFFQIIIIIFDVTSIIIYIIFHVI